MRPHYPSSRHLLCTTHRHLVPLHILLRDRRYPLRSHSICLIPTRRWYISTSRRRIRHTRRIHLMRPGHRSTRHLLRTTRRHLISSHILLRHRRRHPLPSMWLPVRRRGRRRIRDRTNRILIHRTMCTKLILLLRRRVVRIVHRRRRALKPGTGLLHLHLTLILSLVCSHDLCVLGELLLLLLLFEEHHGCDGGDDEDT